MTLASGELSQATQAIVWLSGACPCHPDDQDTATPSPLSILLTAQASHILV